MLDIDSSSSSAITASGNAVVSATGGIDVVGSVQKSGNANVGTVTGHTSVSDPLGSLAIPAVSFSGTPTAVSVSGNSSKTINPGYYGSIQVSGNAVLTFSAGNYVIGGIAVSGNAVVNMGGGIYILAGGGLAVSGNAALDGLGVLIYNGGTGYSVSVSNGVATATDGGSYGTVNFSGNAVMNLTPATSGTFANLLIFQGRSNTQTISLSGNADPSAASVIYAKAAALTLSGNSSVGTANFQATLIASTLTLNGNAIFQLSNPADGTTAFDPDSIRTAYGVNALSLDGSGQTIAIVDAYDNPDIYQSLDTFDSQFGATTGGLSLFQQYGPASSFLTVMNQDGSTTALPGADPTGPGGANWEAEEALDVEWTHAIAPGANIILVEANSQSLSDLMTAVATAARQPGLSVVSMSWGFPEGLSVLAQDKALYDSYFTTPTGHTGVTFVASTGDFGAAVPSIPPCRRTWSRSAAHRCSLMRTAAITVKPDSDTSRMPWVSLSAAAAASAFPKRSRAISRGCSPPAAAPRRTCPSWPIHRPGLGSPIRTTSRRPIRGKSSAAPVSRPRLGRRCSPWPIRDARRPGSRCWAAPARPRRCRPCTACRPVISMT